MARTNPALKVDWSAMSLAQLEEHEANVKAAGKRPPAAMAKALREARADALHEASEASETADPAPEPEPELTAAEQADAAELASSRDPSEVDMETGEVLASKPAEPYALVEAVAKPVTYYWAKVTICVPVEGGGETTETIECVCPYGHERPELAVKHAKKLAAERGVRLA